MPFGHWLRLKRLELGLTQLELAARTGLRNVAISHFELGYRLPTRRDATLLADQLDLALEEIIFRSVRERLLKTDEGRIFLAAVRAGRLYDDDGRYGHAR